MFCLSCKKQGAGEFNAMWLVIMVGVFLLVYIILLPVGEKEKLVGEKPIYGADTGYPPGGQITSGLFLSESPGLLYPPLQQIIGKPLASMNLFAFTEAESQSLATTLSVEKGMFTEKQKKLTFTVQDPKKVEDARLLFLVKEGEDNLIITLNGVEIFDDVVTTEHLPLVLPVALLRPVNTLTFRASSPGLNIFSVNEYLLKDVQVFLTTLHENMEETRTFVLSQSEAQNLKSMTLFFIVNCFTVQEQGRLVILLNGKVVSDGLIVCDAGPVAVDIDPRDIVGGTNVLQFAIDQGKYVLEQIVLEKEVGDTTSARYVFTVQVADLQAISAGAHVLLRLVFPPDNVRKIGAVFVNGYPVYFDTYGHEFVYDITGLVGAGTNILRLLPEVPVHIVSLTVGLA